MKNKRYHIHPPPKFVAAARALERPKRCTVNGVSIHLYHHGKVVFYRFKRDWKEIEVDSNQHKSTQSDQHVLIKTKRWIEMGEPTHRKENERPHLVIWRRQLRRITVFKLLEEGHVLEDGLKGQILNVMICDDGDGHWKWIRKWHPDNGSRICSRKIPLGDFAKVPGVPGVPGLGQHFVQNVSELFFSQNLGHGFTPRIWRDDSRSQKMWVMVDSYHPFM